MAKTKEVKQVPEKKKKKHTGLKVFLILFSVLVVLPVGFVFGAFYTTKTKDTSAVSTELKFDNIANRMFVDGMADIANKESENYDKFHVDLDDRLLDGFMADAVNLIHEKAPVTNDYVDKMYCEINGNDYTFYLDAHLSFFKTRIGIATHMDENADLQQLEFKVTKVILGRLPLPYEAAYGIVSRFLPNPNELIQQAFAGLNLHMTVQLDKGLITYSREQLKEDIGGLIGEYADNQFVSMLLGLLGDTKVFQPNYTNGVHIVFNLETLKPVTTGAYMYAPTYFTFDPVEMSQNVGFINDQLGKAIPTGESSDMEDTAKQTFNFLLRGNTSTFKSTTNEEGDITDFDTWFEKFYPSINNKEDLKDAIEEFIKRDSSKRADDLKSYKGTKVIIEGVESLPLTRFAEHAKYMDELTGDNKPINWISEIPSPPTNKIPLVTIQDTALTQFVAVFENLIGNTTLISYLNTENQSWNTAYIIIDNFYADFHVDSDENIMDLYLGLNVNGCETCIKIPTKIEYTVWGESEEITSLGTISFRIKSPILYGQRELKDSSIVINTMKEATRSIYNNYLEFTEDGVIKFHIVADSLPNENVITAIKQAYDQAGAKIEPKIVTEESSGYPVGSLQLVLELPNP